MAMNRGAFPLQFDREIQKMFTGTYTKYAPEWSQIAKVETFGTGRTYTEAEISGLGPLVSMAEGEPVSYDTPVEGHRKSIQNVKFGRGFQVTEEMIEDELFGTAKKMAGSLATSANVLFEQSYFNLFNNGFGGGTTSWDGVQWFGNHTTLKSAQVLNNSGTAADLSQAAVEAAFDHYEFGLTDEAGIPITMKPNRLLVPSGSRWLANSIVNSMGRLWDGSAILAGTVAGGTATSNQMVPNFLNPQNGLVSDWTVFASRWITDSDSWFLLTPEHDARFYWRRKPMLKSWDDPNTGNRMYKVTTRFALGVFNWRGAYGNPGV